MKRGGKREGGRQAEIAENRRFQGPEHQRAEESVGGRENWGENKKRAEGPKGDIGKK